MLSNLYLLFIVVTWFIILLKPIYGIYIFNTFLLISPDQFFPEFDSYRLALTTAIILLFSCLLREFKITHMKFIGAILLFAGVNVLSILFSDTIRITQFDAITIYLKAFSISIITILFIKKRHELIVYIRFVVTFIACNGLLAVYQQLFQKHLEASRSVGFQFNSNVLACLLTASLPLAYYLFSHEKSRFLKLMGIVSISCIVLGVFCSVSRAGLIALTVTILFIFFKNKNKIVNSVLIFIFVIVFLYFAKDLLTQRQTVTTSASGRVYYDNSTNIRLQLIQGAFRLWLHNPIWGVGLGNFMEKNVDESGRKGKFVAHNSFLEILAETGLCGILCFLFILFTSFKMAAQLKHKERYYQDLAEYLQISLLSSCIVMFFGTFYLSAFFWVLLGLPFVLDNIAGFENSTALRVKRTATG